MVLMDHGYNSVITESLVPLAPITTDETATGKLPRLPRAVLFDIYGTLLVSGTGDISLAALQNEAVGIEEILDTSGFPVLLPESAAESTGSLMEGFIRETHSRARQAGTDYPEVDIREIWKQVLIRLWKDGILESDPEETDVDLLALRHEMSVNPVWPMPGFPDIVSGIQSKGIRTGIVSNAQFYTPLILEALTGKTLDSIGFEEELCVWSYRLRRAKPSPEVFSGPLSVLESSRIDAGEILYVGNDMVNDIAAASRAGCMTVLFAGDGRSLRKREGDERADRKPDAVITELKQLETIIGGGTL